MERRAFRTSGFLLLGVLLLLVVVYLVVAATMARIDNRGVAEVVMVTVTTIGSLAVMVIVVGFTVVNPNEARVIQFFGRYVGSIRDAGFHWTGPFSTKA